MSHLRNFAAWTFAATLGLTACGGGKTDPPSGPSASITVTANPASLSVEQGAGGTVVITLVRGGGYTGTVTATVEGLPAGITVTFNPASLSGSATSTTATVAVAVAVAPGTYNATIRASGSGVGDATGSYSITVTARPDFSLSATPAALSIPAGLSATSLVTITRNNFTAPVTMTLDNPPAGITAVFTPASVTDTTRIALTVAKTVVPGDYPVTVTGTAAPGAKTTVITVTVTPEPSYTLAIAPAAAEIIQGGQGTATVTLTRTNFTGPVTLALDNPPAGVTATFVPAAPTGTTSVMTVTVAGSVVPGLTNLSIKGTASGVPSVRAATPPSPAPGDRAAPFGLTVVPASLSLPASVTIAQGSQAGVTVSITRAALFTGPVTLSVAGRPSPTQISFTPTVVAGATSTMTVTPNGTPVGTYPLIINGATGTAGDPTARIDLIVTSPANGSAGNFKFCDPSQFPVWFAYRDGTGPWIHVTPTTSGSVQSYPYTIAASVGEVAYAQLVQFALRGQASARIVENASRGPRRGLGEQVAAMVAAPTAQPTPNFYNTVIIRGSRAELQGQGFCGFPFGSTSTPVTVTNMPAGERAVISRANQGNTVFNTNQSGNLNYLDGAHDWWTVFVPSSGPWLKYLRGSAHVAGTPILLDRAAAQPLLAATVTVNGLPSGGTYGHSVGLQNWQERVASFSLGGNGPTATMQGFAATNPGDFFFHALSWAQGAGNLADYLTVTHYFAPFGALTYPAPALPTITSITDLGSAGGFPEFQLDGPIPAEYNGVLTGIFTGGLISGGFNQVFVSLLPGYREATGVTNTYSIAIPNLSGLQLPAGTAMTLPLTSYRIMMTGSNVGQSLTTGSTDIVAQHVVTLP